MKNTTLKITLFAAIILTALILISGGRHKQIGTYEFTADKITVDADDWTVKLGHSSDELVHVNIFSNQKNAASLPLSISCDNGLLTITQTKVIKDFISNFTFGGLESIEILIPENMEESIAIHTNSGDLYIRDIEKLPANISSNTGDIITLK